MKTTAALILMLGAPAFAQSNPSAMPKIGTVDPRFQSYNVEMVEVIGGRFWKPYASTKPAEKPAGGTPGIDPSLYEQRTPIDLSNPRLRMLAAALGPAYIPRIGDLGEHRLLSGLDAPALGSAA